MTLHHRLGRLIDAFRPADGPPPATLLAFFRWCLSGAWPGLGFAAIASALRGWDGVRYEVTEEPSPGLDGSRWSHTPELGVFHAMIDVHGNIMVSEDRIRYAYEVGAGDPTVMYQELSLALGEAWDEELEPFRHAADGAPVRWLSRVG